MALPEKKTIACFGATGGCVGTSLASALKKEYYCTALARTPEKLRNLLATDHGISQTTIDRYLTIFQGDVKNPDDIAKALVSPTNKDLLVDVILSGVGCTTLTVELSIKRPIVITDKNICETAIGAMYTALRNLASSPTQPITLTSTGEKPLLIVISTAGCGRNRGIPLPVYPQYHYILGSPLADKKCMEKLVLEDNGKHVRDFVIMRPLVLTAGEPRGDAGLRMGWEWGNEDSSKERAKEPGPEIGYYVSRKDVGIWTFEHVIVQGGWEGKCIYLTY